MEPFAYSLCSVLDRSFQSALPNDGNPPIHGKEQIGMALISHHIRFKLLSPKLLVTFGSGGVAAPFVSMPKASMNKHCRPVLWKHQIGRAWQLCHMEPITEASRKKRRTEAAFRPSIFTSNARHHAATLRCSRSCRKFGHAFSQIDQNPLGLD